MENTDFKTIFAGVRPPRLAVLVDIADAEWQETCRRVIEFLSWTWGGEHSIIVPTDGSSIASEFWSVLEAFDPDYIFYYAKTGRDIQISAPAKFEERLETEIEAHFGKNASPSQREMMEEALGNAHFVWGISLELQRELRARLAPFYYDESVATGNAISARSSPTYPITPVSTILPNHSHPDHVSVFSFLNAALPPLWVESVTGAAHPAFIELLRMNGVGVREVPLDDDLTHLFELIFEGRIDAIRERMKAAMAARDYEASLDFMPATPFRFAMLGLSRYRSIKDKDWESPIVVIYGATLNDFCLYFDLCRIRAHVHWFLPVWAVEAAAVRAEGEARGDTSALFDLCANQFANQVLRIAQAKGRGIECISLSRTPDELTEAISALDRSLMLQGRLDGQVRVVNDATPYLSHPHTVFNTNNYSVATTRQVLESRCVGFFPTPKPKGFTTIVPYDHRWLTEIWIEGHAYPRHPLLGTWLVRHNLLHTNEVRVGSRGIVYCCPSPAYFGGDVDTILIRPQINVPNATELFTYLASANGWSAKHSDKGLYSAEAVRKLGGLSNAAMLLRNQKGFSVLQSYLDDAKSQSAGTKFLASDRRRYLEFTAILTRFLDQSSAVAFLDDLIERQILNRGLVLKCDFCRNADWFPASDLDAVFRCKRCRRQQPILSRHACGNPEPVWSYQLDEVAYQGLRNDMHVPLLALDYLQKQAASFLYTDELELRKSNEERPFIEIDICCVCDGVLTIGEAKSTDRIDGGGKRERRSLTKYKDAAAAIGAKCFVLATSLKWSAETAGNVQRIFSGTNIRVVILDRDQIL